VFPVRYPEELGVALALAVVVVLFARTPSLPLKLLYLLEGGGVWSARRWKALS
jgi:hypothetical protein